MRTIIIQNLQRRIPINPDRIRGLIRKTLTASNWRRPCEITVCFVTDRLIQRLNERYLGHHGPTDVLAFGYNRRMTDGLTADIVISAQTAARNARQWNTSVAYELGLYAVHGTLHLLGYRDLTARQHRRMDQEASRILACQSIKPKRSS